MLSCEKCSLWKIEAFFLQEILFSVKIANNKTAFIKNTYTLKIIDKAPNNNKLMKF